jgi:predicted extracellular nuclease
MRFNYSFARLTTALCFTFLATQSVFAQSVFINEIHYDNSSSDVGEAVEVAGPAGTDLSGWSIALYNGSSSQRNVYRTINLSGVIPNQDNGFGALSFLQSGIQNGSPDGLALIDASDAVIQFLSYEGSFTAASGPADGMTSTDIGVSESGSSAIGNSLQLTGPGLTYGDFVWMGSTTSTFGSPNSGQSFGEAGGIVINEVDSDTAGTDTGEFVELFDGGAGNTALDDLVLVFYNGKGDASDDAYDLDGYNTDADGYFVLGNVGVIPAPSIVFSNNGLQNGADAVALYSGDATSFPNGTAVTTSNLIDALVYDTNDSDDAGLLILLNAGQAQINEGGSGNKDGHSNQRCPNGSGGARNTSSYAQFAPTPGAVNICVAPARELKIHEVQGSGAASPEVGNTVVIEGIVVGDFQDGADGTNGDLNGFYVQEEDADADGDATTSEGLFVFDGSSPAVNVEIGDLVRVEGSVSEFSGATQIRSFSGVSVQSTGNALPTASVLTLPVTNADQFEAYEGMYITFSQALTISDYFNFDRFNEIVLTNGRHLTPTAEFEPGPDANAAADAFELNQILLDDGRTASNPDPAIHPNGGVFDLDNLFRGGDTLTNVTGVMGEAFGAYRIQPTQGATHSNNNPRPITPDDVGGNLTVASSNVLNYFTTLGNTCGPSQDQNCRGADDAEEFDRQRAKIIAVLAGMDADIVGLVEIENNVNDDAVIDLVSGLNDATAPGTYDYVATGAIGTDAIKVALIYKPASASLVGGHAILDSSVDPRFLDQRNRPVLAQTFIDNTTGGIFTVAVNHLKSKGSNCNNDGDPNTGDGSGNCNLTRTAAAEALVDWLASDPTGSGDEDFIIVGDLNAYDKEDPIDAIIAGGYTDLLSAFQGEDAYSFVFGAQTGYLDYALSSSNLSPQVTGTTAWHINADEPDLLNYDTRFKKDAQDAIFAADAYRSSDHDPVIVGLDTCDEIPPTIDAIYLTHDVLWPANHKYVDIDVNVFASDNFDTDVDVSLLSVTSNEADNGVGDGNTINDIVTINDLLIKLRAERSGKGSGRVYTMTYQATDDCGNTATAEATVSVPHDKGKKKSR